VVGGRGVPVPDSRKLAPGDAGVVLSETREPFITLLLIFTKPDMSSISTSNTFNYIIYFEIR